ncbi:hypothetical protein F9B16_09080 [Actinomadura montaniterrae]|uniref:Uncharacterized protein n=1 Tax=Actinomadura montaniterrae TaxID=1803903 RepID=A0A6L3VXS8_9ACTN|nr:hypothetical protein F9B16_09080 [Actinomadura montaniterrae]
MTSSCSALLRWWRRSGRTSRGSSARPPAASPSPRLAARADLTSRVFVPAVGWAEDHVTGSAHAVLGAL